MEQHVVVLGAGIKGCAIAALLASTGEFAVTLVDQHDVSAGTTSTNHGRLHLGTSGWRHESAELIRRRFRGSQLMRTLPDVITSEQAGLYCFERAADADHFVRTCYANAIPHRRIEKRALRNAWITYDNFATVFQVPEFSFNPARVAGRLAQFCADHNGTLYLRRAATRVREGAQQLVVDLADGTRLEADLVINATTRWANTVEPPLPELEVTWHQWRLLCLRRASVPHLDQVTVVVDPQRKDPSAIPHRDWITLDCKVDVDQVTSPEGMPNAGWRSLDLNDRMDAEMYHALKQYFAPVRQLSEKDWSANLFSFAGIHGRRKNAPVGSTNQVERHPELPAYVVTFGGQASTALLDAVEVLEYLAAWGLCRVIDRHALIEKVASQLPEEAHPSAIPMIWEQMAKT